jgi:hypothetical protein
MDSNDTVMLNDSERQPTVSDIGVGNYLGHGIIL